MKRPTPYLLSSVSASRVCESEREGASLLSAMGVLLHTWEVLLIV